ncbi:MAG: hypothetical protein ABIP54_02625 [Candidatus Andersenbacteria bacterium]
MKSIRKIAILGISGSGKSTLSRQLEELLDLPVIHMDQIFWRGNWEEVPSAEYLAMHEEKVEESSWIIEGYIDVIMSNRTKLADLIIYLDYSGLRCALRVLKRWLVHRNQSRPELPKEALERFSTNFLWMVLHRGERQGIEDALQKVNPEKIKRFRSPRELTNFLQNMSL